jgi:hypothetical protein
MLCRTNDSRTNVFRSNDMTPIIFSPMERKDSKKHKRTQSLKKPKKSGGEGAAPAVPPKPVKITIL